MPPKIEHITHNRHWTKKTMCPYCFCEVSHFSRHLIRIHSQEGAVKEYKMLDSKDPKRKMLINTMRNQGNYLHGDKSNVICPNGRPKCQTDHYNDINSSEDYIVCPDCLGYFKKKYLRRHRKKCHLQSNFK